MDARLLIEKANIAMQNAYAPYSNFKVGAALLTQNGKIYTGCNIENVSFGGSICAERVAFLKAISEGEKEFLAIAVVNSSTEAVFPCGICRQFMAEFGTQLTVIVAGPSEFKTYSLAELLPHSFDAFMPELQIKKVEALTQ